MNQEIDIRIGASFMRFQTMLLKDAFVFIFSIDGRNLVLSYGPCQCTHTADEATSTFNWMRGHLFDYTCAVLLYEMCLEEPMATVTKVRQQEKLKYKSTSLCHFVHWCNDNRVRGGS
ncbi:hypothetical protein LXL04_002579 [Taraxacum kok-saghyz]